MAVPDRLTGLQMAVAIQRGLDERQRIAAPDLEHVADYHEGLVASGQAGRVDDATWTDLNLDAVLVATDHTASQIGRQFLYHTLRQPQFTAATLERAEAATQRFTRDRAAVNVARDALRSMAEPRAAFVTQLLFGELAKRPAYWWLFPALTCASIACLIAIAFWPKALLVWLAVCVANIAVQMLYRPKVRRLIVAFQSLPALIRSAQRIARLDSDGIEDEVAVLQAGASQLASLKRATSWLLFEPGTANEFVSSLYEYVNMLFLIDINAFLFSLRRVQEARPLLRRVFDAIGRIDVAQSTAHWRTTLPAWSTPTFTSPGRTLSTTAMYHPLLAAPVANSLRVDGASVLITGSNMAGKTTFMRTLGVNAVLAQTLNTVCAREWTAPYLHVAASIGRADSLLDGKSHYLAEVESVHALLSAKAPDRQHLFLLDEMFRGTNTAERVAAAYAVLKYLASGHDIVVVATHDLELVSLLGSSFNSYHFREIIADNALSFDYLLRAGPSDTRNAIALLELKQYPASIIADAMAVLDRATGAAATHPPVDA